MKALIMEGRVVDVSAEPFEVADNMFWEDAPTDCKAGWIYKDGQFIDPDEKTPEEIASIQIKYLRSERNKKLKASDWTQMPDVDLTSTQKTEWANYRQALRDVPQQAGFPTEITWPQKP